MQQIADFYKKSLQWGQVVQVKHVLLAAMLIFLVLPLSNFAADYSAAGANPSSQEMPVTEPFYYKDKVLVLLYHHIDPAEGGVTITPNRFAGHLQAIADNHYNVISMEQYLNFVRTGSLLPQNAVLITFDDGYASFYTYAYPELMKQHFPATHFIVVKSTDVKDPQAKPHLTWDQMREMKQNGMSFFSHTYELHGFADTTETGNGKPKLANPLYLSEQKRVESQAEYRTRIEQDLQLAEKRLQEELGEQPSLLAYPYGAYNDTVVNVGKSLGVELFFTVDEGINDRSGTQVFRVNAGSADLSAEGLLAKMKNYIDPKGEM